MIRGGRRRRLLDLDRRLRGRHRHLRRRGRPDPAGARPLPPRLRGQHPARAPRRARAVRPRPAHRLTHHGPPQRITKGEHHEIGILGTGNIGSTLARRLPTAGHDVLVANSRGPETIDADLLTEGARAVTAAEAVQDVDVAILSIPLVKLPGIAGPLTDLPEGTVILDTSNYYPMRDETIEAIGRHPRERVGHRAARPADRQGVERRRLRDLRERRPPGRGTPSGSASPSPATTPAPRRSPPVSSTTRASTPSTPVPWPTRGASSRARPSTAPT